MYCPSDYLTVEQVIERVEEPEYPSCPKEICAFNETLESVALEALESTNELSICSPKGSLLRISPEFLSRIDMPSSLSTYAEVGLFDCHMGCGGEGNLRSLPMCYERQGYTISPRNYKWLRKTALKVRPHYTEADLWMEFGAPFRRDPLWNLSKRFDGYSICVPMNLVPHKISFESRGAEKEIALKNEIGLSRQLIASFDEGRFGTKQEALLKFGSAVSRRGFERAWSLAAIDRPAMSLPGRKKS